jgi:hypothetical protein
MKRLLIFIAATCLFVSSYSCGQNPKPSAKEIYELQERCGKQTSEFFKKEYGNGIASNGIFSGYQNHYNKKLNKCFIIITSTSPSMKLKNLFDFNENKELGSFVVNKYLPMDCRVFEKKCKSEEEWDSLVKPYMEE